MDIADLIQHEVDASIKDWDWANAGERVAAALTEAGVLVA